ncbi:MAG: hypothetical protein Ct9H90mP21_2050 [Methanobacteriota archaeon]|nr:MAG: hypothetical protein Ct9H90mP21_2050 [Euryarchaeota archaeon]
MKFWGPFPDAGSARLVVKLLRRHFGIRDKTDKPPSDSSSPRMTTTKRG